MKNVTISKPDERARRAKALAAEVDTSMSQYLCRLAAEKTAATDDYEVSRGEVNDLFAWNPFPLPRHCSNSLGNSRTAGSFPGGTAS